MTGPEEMAVIDVKIPVPDSQYCLRPCRCGCTGVGYLRIRSDSRDLWEVRCFGCGKTGELFPVRHDAQIYWNSNMAAPPVIRRVM